MCVLRECVGMRASQTSARSSMKAENVCANQMQCETYFPMASANHECDINMEVITDLE